MSVHAKFIREYVNGSGALPVNVMYYFLVYALSLFSTDVDALLVASLVLLSFATFFKYYIVKRIVLLDTDSDGMGAVLASWISFFLLFSFNLPVIYCLSGKFYLGSYPPNVWHNSTTILAMPFVLLLFWYSAKQLVEFSSRRNVLLLLLVLLNVLAKPSFVFAYILSFPFLLFINYSLTADFWKRFVPVVFACLLIGIQYVIQYITGAHEQGAVAFVPFQFVDIYLAHGDNSLRLLYVSCGLFSSIFFPIVFLLRNRQQLRNVFVQFAVFGFIAAFLISQFIGELGPRSTHGNFIWQMIMCVFILFFVCALQLAKLVLNHQKSWRAYIPEIIAFLLHSASLVFYFVDLLVKLN